jgi:uncharacterized protein YdcH (DUF465 family)
MEIELIERKVEVAEDRLAAIDSGLAVLSQRLTDHTEQDEANFDRLSDQVSVLDGKIDTLLIREAAREGELKGLKRAAVIVAGAVSLAVSIAGIAVAAFVN